MSDAQSHMPLHPVARRVLDALKPSPKGDMLLPIAEHTRFRAEVLTHHEDRELALHLWFIHAQLSGAGAMRAAAQFLQLATICFRDIVQEAASMAAQAMSGRRKTTDPLARPSRGVQLRGHRAAIVKL
jgi:hypothetical protein